MNLVACKIPCDYCGKRPANFFGLTSVAICSDEKCQAKNRQKWEAHCVSQDLEPYYDDERIKSP
jgi:hypothetical protein